MTDNEKNDLEQMCEKMYDATIEQTKKNKQKISQRFSRELSEINYIL
ncbi:hypothetical protein SAMN02745123_01774 [Desulforamulus aeronauticus DSM 10349]|uniref:Uncharacterized protein n=1 Tax=Desulforamulus aeronauticus DSM 10349 TaxID=1121421 RepID=A0A1M6SAV8_9FIRM|nr:hypothetical protein SAMN02745123_01774 [Desulforamulus aeronauticus DSM 10349]